MKLLDVIIASILIGHPSQGSATQNDSNRETDVALTVYTVQELIHVKTVICWSQIK